MRPVFCLAAAAAALILSGCQSGADVLMRAFPATTEIREITVTTPWGGSATAKGVRLTRDPSDAADGRRDKIQDAVEAAPAQDSNELIEETP